MKNTNHYRASEVAEMLGISIRTANNRIKEINDELTAQGMIIVPGRVPKSIFRRKCPYLFEDTEKAPDATDA